MNEGDILNIAAASGAGACALFGGALLFLLKKLFADAAKNLERAEKLLADYRTECQCRYEKTVTEYRQIMETLNEIKIKLARAEAASMLQELLMDDD